MNFLEKISHFYEHAIDKLNNNFGNNEKSLINNEVIVLKNMIHVSKGTKTGEEYDGFPLILCLFHIINKSLELIQINKFESTKYS